MKTCPKCGEMNGNGNAKCFNCGADLPMPVEKPKTVAAVPSASAPQTLPVTASENTHSTAIKNMGAAVIIASIVAGLIIGFFFPAYSSINWIMAASEIASGLLFAVILFALAHIAEAQEETTKALLKFLEQKNQ